MMLTQSFIIYRANVTYKFATSLHGSQATQNAINYIYIYRVTVATVVFFHYLISDDEFSVLIFLIYHT